MSFLCGSEMVLQECDRKLLALVVVGGFFE